MNLFKIAAKVGKGLIKAAVPGSGLFFEAANALLPDDKQINQDTTGDQLTAIIESLPADQKAAVLGKEFDVEIIAIQEAGDTLRTMLESDARTPHSTRPKCIWAICQTVCSAVIINVALWAIAVASENVEMVKAVMAGGDWVLKMEAPLVAVLWAYFGILKVEHRDRLNAAGGNPPVDGMIKMIGEAIRGR